MGRAFEVRKSSMLKTGMAKAKIYSRHSKEIYLAAKNGVDPDSNLTLKRAMEKAKKDQVPADVIKRAIEKAKSGTGEDYKAKSYEGFGPSGSTIIVECLTDNDNRTISEVKNCFTKTDNRLGVSGSVTHMYNYLGVISLKGISEDAVMECLIENDIDMHDMEIEDDIISIYVQVPDFMNARNALTTICTEEEIVEDEITWIAMADVILDGDEEVSFNKMISMLNECDDVQNIYHNVENI